MQGFQIRIEFWDDPAGAKATESDTQKYTCTHTNGDRKDEGISPRRHSHMSAHTHVAQDKASHRAMCDMRGMKQGASLRQLVRCALEQILG